MKIDSHKRSIAKSLSWRLISIMIVFSVSFGVTRNVKMAVGISVIDMFIKMLTYYYHERIWTHIKWGRIKIKKNKLQKKKNKKKQHKKKLNNEETEPEEIMQNINNSDNL